MGGERIGYLDAMKCLGTILVIEGHVRGYGMNLGAYDSLSGLMLYSFNMPMFFFVSGFLAYKAQRYSAKKIFKQSVRKFINLVIPAFLFVLYWALLNQDNPLDLLVNGVGRYWFTITLWECFLIYYVVLLGVRNSLMRDILLMVIALVGMTSLCLYGEYGPKLIDMNRLTKYFPYFVIGVFAMKYKELYKRIVSSEWLNISAIMGFFGLLFTINYCICSASLFHFLRDIILRYLGLFVVVSWFTCHAELFKKDNRINKVLLNIGRKSLPIYLLQYFFLPDLPFLEGVDIITTHVISFSYSIVILLICIVFISLLSNSFIIKKYVLGQHD